MTHDEREALLREIVLGERSVDDPLVVAAVAEDPSFAREIDSLRSVVDSLEAVGVLQEAQRRAAAPARVSVPSRPSAPRRFALVALAAAAALTVIFWRPWERVTSDDPYLGGEVVTIEYPTDGAASDYSRFAWTLPRGLSRARVTVFDAASGRESDQEFTDQLEWRPAPERSARWPDAIELEVQPIDDSEQPVGRPARRVTRREP